MEAGTARSTSFTPLVGVLDMQESQKAGLSSLCAIVRGQSPIEEATAAALALTSDLVQAHSLYSSRMNAPDAGDNSLAIDERMLLDVELLDWFFSKVSSVVIEHNYRLASKDAFAPFLPIDVSCFSNCRSLGLRCLPLNVLCGVAKLRGQIESLSVTHCRNVTLDGVLAKCLADQTDSGGWTRLKKLSLGHNKIFELGDSSVLSRLAPDLERVDFGYNELREIAGLDSLPKLTHVILGHNALSGLPLLYSEARPLTLSMPHNCLEVLTGLETMTSLVQIDLSWNLLMHHDVLAPISLLPKLKVLNLQGNPMSVRRDHRIESVQWLNPSVNPDVFLLDGVVLSTRERRSIGLSRLVPNTPSTVPLSRSSPDGAEAQADGEDEGVAVPNEAATVSGEPSIVSAVSKGSGGTGKRSVKKKRAVAARVAVIAEPKDNEDIEKERSQVLSGAAAKQKEDVKDSEHLDTMKKIEQLRRMYGEEDWLHSQGAEQVHAVLGIEKSDPRSVAEIVAQRLADEERRREDINKFVEQATASVLARSAMGQAEEQGQLDSEEQDSFEERVRAKGATHTDGVEKQESAAEVSVKGSMSEGQCVAGQEKKKSGDMTASVYGVYTGTLESEEDPADLRIVVQRKLSSDINESSGEVGQRLGEELYLRISHDTIREETPSGLTLETWFMHSLSDFEMLVREPLTVQLAFNVSQREKRGRRYVLGGGEPDYFRLVSVMQPVLEAHAKSALLLSTLQCIKCQVQFTMDLPGNSGQLRSCPSCGSTMIIELERSADDTAAEAAEFGVPACEDMELELQASPPATPQASSLKETEFRRKLNDSSTPKKEGDRSERNRSVESEASIGSGVVAEPRSQTADSSTRRSGSSSDISVLSNPSQCSIEVLSQGQQPQQSEADAYSAFGDDNDQRVAMNHQTVVPEPELKTSALTPLPKKMNPMMESSSSGSMTESVIIANAAKMAQHESVAVIAGEASVKSPDRTFESERTSLAGDTDDASSYKTCNSGSASLSSAQMVTANSTLASVAGNSTIVTEDVSALSDASTPRVISKSSPVTPLKTAAVAPPPAAAGMARMGLFGALKGTASSTSNSSPRPPRKSPEDEAVQMELLESGTMEWNYDDFTQADHRVKLYCDLSLCQDADETVLLMAKSTIVIPGPGRRRMFAGVFVVSNMKAYVLRMTRTETEDPEEWLELVESRPINQLSGIVRMIGGVGVGMEFSKSAAFYVIFREPGKTERFAEQLSTSLMENVRSQPLPDSDVAAEEGALIQEQLEKSLEDVDATICVFQMGRFSAEKGNPYMNCSIIVTPSHIVIFEDFIRWIFFTDSKTPMCLLGSVRIQDLKNIKLYDDLPERLKIFHGDKGSSFSLLADSEPGLNELIDSLRTTWKNQNGTELEEIISYYLSRDGETLQLHTLYLHDSMEASAFNLSEWIQVIKRRKSSTSGKS